MQLRPLSVLGYLFTLLFLLYPSLSQRQLLHNLPLRRRQFPVVMIHQALFANVFLSPLMNACTIYEGGLSMVVEENSFLFIAV